MCSEFVVQKWVPRAWESRICRVIDDRDDGEVPTTKARSGMCSHLTTVHRARVQRWWSCASRRRWWSQLRCEGNLSKAAATAASRVGVCVATDLLWTQMEPHLLAVLLTSLLTVFPPGKTLLSFSLCRVASSILYWHIAIANAIFAWCICWCCRTWNSPGN